jgi:hypothetical protein
MSKLSRSKGHAWEREVCAMIRKATGRDAQRILHETRDGNCGDIDTPRIPLAWQCKVGARPDIYGAVKEAKEAAGERFAVAVVRRNGAGRRPSDDLAVLPLDDFLEIVGLLTGTRVW